MKTTVELTLQELREITQALELRYDELSDSKVESKRERAEKIAALAERLLNIRRSLREEERKQEKVTALYNRYQADLKALEREYDEKFDSVPVNAAGEASAEYILHLNRWYDSRRNEINRCFTEALKEVKK